MRQYQDYLAARIDLESKKDTRILDYENKAYDYGVLTVKNAFLVAGAGLVAVPAIVGLGSSAQIDASHVAIAGILFACSLIFALVATYLIHINWTLHAAYIEKQKLSEITYLLKVYDDETLVREGASIEYPSISRWLRFTFYTPHLIAVLFLISISCGWYNPYAAFDII